MKRREFLRATGWGVVVVGMGMTGAIDVWAKKAGDKASKAGVRSTVFRARGTDYSAMTKAAVGKLGGMGKFVSRGAKVVIKPNVGWDAPSDFRANTHPDIVRAAVEMALAAGAADIRIVDFPVYGQNPKNAFDVSGMSKVGKDLGVKVYPVYEEAGFAGITIPDAKKLKDAKVIREVLDADVVINIPIAKSHVCTHYTGALKNWMGIVWDRKFFHDNFQSDFRTSDRHRQVIAQCIADINARVRPALTIVDATKIMTKNGPEGPGPLVEKNEILAGKDPVALDAYALSLFDTIKREEVLSLDRAAELGLGEANVSRVAVVDAT